MDAAFDSQVKGFLIGAREAGKMLSEGGRIIAITYGTGSRTGGLLPWVAMGSAKAAMESLVRYFAVAFARRGITVNAISPGWTEDSVFNSLPEDRKSTRLNSSHVAISYAVFCLKKNRAESSMDG